ncbi:hypothetical protein A5757_10360 [Mycobacterium sp. 852013-51886_SCH5428379]|uniref:hypothetical protein n=1 Tax=Mycobacterium sp. 852013-51886_SCH5428379 TaxID=1834111 RepID=UPI0008016A38|nr:hypothetical protein [Mycobacterium sp. 852013-51886_SCH5428379]OBB60068.1 hypothetical protein A5757_10360 [Mycobacterium sp. 852013-51886_SCH5428379]
MTTNTVVLIAVVAAVALIAAALSLAVTYRFRADRRQLAGGSILDQAVQDTQEDAMQAARVEVGIEAFRTRRRSEKHFGDADFDATERH